MTIECLVPLQREFTSVELQNLAEELSLKKMVPFNEQAINFCAALSAALFADPKAKLYGDLQALAFFLRKPHILGFSREYELRSKPGTSWVPRGLAFHIPPSNVDTIFVYSWVLSLLVGNPNLVRIPRERSPQIRLLLERINNILADESFPDLRGQNYFLSYGHEREITAALSKFAGIRVIWGGDQTIREVRSIPLASDAKEIVFADRYSIALFHANSYLELSSDKQVELARLFFNDTYPFNQSACSSPRLLIWEGNQVASNSASQIFFKLLQEILETKDTKVATSTALHKLAFSSDSILKNPVESYHYYSNELTVLRLDSLTQFKRDHCGGGLLYEALIENLDSLIPFVNRKDQTLTHFGFDQLTLQSLATKLNGKGIERIVPCGSALNFSPVWDGYDLFREFSKQIAISFLT